MLLLWKKISEWLYDNTVERIAGDIIIVYTVEIIIIAVLCIYGIASENGFRAFGY